MKHNCGGEHIRRLTVVSVVVLGLLAGTPALRGANIPRMGCCKREGLEPKIEAAINEFRVSVPGMMEKGGIPGAALALVDAKGIVWTEGFGYLGGKGKETPNAKDRVGEGLGVPNAEFRVGGPLPPAKESRWGSEPKQPVTPDTPFMICGLSKLITATAVMLAVQDGAVKLDEPITTYLPDFQVNSRYEEHPEQKITLRRLLNCTAGIPTEAPLGNYLEPASTVSFEDHIKSLYGSWLVCPVGGSFYLSDASFDLAAYTVRVVTGKLLKDYLREKLFRPLGMSNTTANRQEILDNSERAVGHMMGMAKVPAVYPALGAIGLYSTARDMARLLQLHINRGTLDGRPLVERSLMETIHAPVGIVSTKPTVYYGQGIRVDKRALEGSETLLWHDGLGFGFLSLVHWYPEYGVGMVVLINRLPNSVLNDLSLTLTDKLIKEKIVAKRFPRPAADCTGGIDAWWGWPQHRPTPYKPEWGQYCGTHNLRFNEYQLEWWAHAAVIIHGRDEFTPRITVQEKDGFLCVTESKFFQTVNALRLVNESLQEIRPGVFAAKGGGTLDFTREVPTWCNYRLEER